MQLRTYQEEAIEKLRDGFRRGHKSQILQMATGSGKTLTAAKIIKTATSKGGRVWFIVDNLELVEQTIEVFESIGLDVGVIQGIHEKTDYRKNVQIVTAQTITRRWNIIDSNPQWRPTMIMIDESHCIYKSHHEMINMFEGIPIIGLSATPWAKNMGNMYSNLVIGATTEQLINEGYLCKYEAYGPTTPDLSNVSIQAGDYKTDELAQAMNTKEIVGDVVTTWLRLGENRQTLCYAVNIAHSKAIADEFNCNGVIAQHIDGRTPKEDRKKILQDFKEGKIKLLSSVGVLTKGVDVPSATCMIIARPTKSLMLHYQILGRVLRVSPCGKDALILDHAGNLSRLGLPTDETPDQLCTGKKANRTEKKKEEIEKELKAPKPCPDCGYLHNTLKCPRCGKEYFKNPEVIALEGELGKLVAKEKTPAEKRNRTWSNEDKQAFYSTAIVHYKGKVNQASWLYKDYFSVWPNAMEKTQKYSHSDGNIFDAVNKFAKHKKIAFIKSKEKRS